MSCLPGSSAGWALPAKMICTGRSRIVDQLGQPIEIGHDQVGPLVGGEPPGEADRQHVRIEHVARGFDRVVALAAAAALPAHAAADERQQQVLQRVVRFPQLARIDAGESFCQTSGSPIRCIQSAGKLRS